MIAVEYLGGLPQRQAAAPVEVTVDRQALRFKYGGFLHGWSHQLPLATIARVELTTGQEARAAGLLPPGGDGPPGQAGDEFLAIDTRLGERTTSVVLRGPRVALEHLRQDILKGRMRAAKQWKP